ncbi:Sas10/Utp3/C1D family-domain-containing protein [Kickxella alabastrina]|uniref:Uncharacterized protein n=1 Tax=Kickxella alabastrina TaxID=61397 RepID=A0ACC1IX71_9FUNG|nr:Sas10/Utp3/C1D family-domain-containing protein [Kickxella alabastrina]KAI7834890.1 Sas10/Utp3/C1D family-domain-containing protein [Kickxella alabastrina]KAJ1902319.1 hypothetical protein LPJ66_000079 [Kickxella alabastrina]KAJ1947939.1 hypothetical protein GGF37_000086 [Kickxella alabastrina]
MDKKLSKQVDQLDAAIEQVERALGPILSQPLNEQLSKLSAIERCELEALIAYSIDTLFWIYLKVNGVPPKEHPVMAELQRVQRYIGKINKAKGINGEDGGGDRMKLDKQAADRFIRNAISSNK